MYTLQRNVLTEKLATLFNSGHWFCHFCLCKVNPFYFHWLSDDNGNICPVLSSPYAFISRYSTELRPISKSLNSLILWGWIRFWIRFFPQCRNWGTCYSLYLKHLQRRATEALLDKDSNPLEHMHRFTTPRNPLDSSTSTAQANFILEQTGANSALLLLRATEGRYSQTH